MVLRVQYDTWRLLEHSIFLSGLTWVALRRLVAGWFVVGLQARLHVVTTSYAILQPPTNVAQCFAPPCFRYIFPTNRAHVKGAQLRDGGVCFAKRALPEKDGVAEDVGTLRRSAQAQNKRKTSANPRNKSKRVQTRKTYRIYSWPKWGAATLRRARFPETSAEIRSWRKTACPSRKNV